MTTLAFTHNGWRVITNSWSVASKWGDRIRIVYTWGPDVISFFDNRVSTASVDFVGIKIEDFERLGRSRSFVDLDNL